MLTVNHLRASFSKSLRTFINVLPIIVGMLLMTSLVVTLFPEKISAGLFGNGNILDSLLAATVGSINCQSMARPKPTGGTFRMRETIFHAQKARLS